MTWKYLTFDRGGEVVGLNPSIRIYRYTKGQFFDQHCKFPILCRFLNSSRVSASDIRSRRENHLHHFFSLTTVDDESNIVNLPTKPNPTPAKTTWTLLLYLTSAATGCEGGQTVFYPDDIPHKRNPIEKEIVVELETGMLLLHKHGNECMLVSFLKMVDLMERTS